MIRLTVGIHEVTGGAWTWVSGGIAFIRRVMLPQFRLLVRVARSLAVLAVGLAVVLPLQCWIRRGPVDAAARQALSFRNLGGLLDGRGARSAMTR